MNYDCECLQAIIDGLQARIAQRKQDIQKEVVIRIDNPHDYLMAYDHQYADWVALLAIAMGETLPDIEDVADD
jgi:deoxyadenosine/deoxycytidine kinase